MIAILVVLPCIALAIKKLMRGKRKEATLFRFCKGTYIKKTK
jgi:hypothetical protein